MRASPAYDHAQMTGIAASHVVYELITLMAMQLDDPAADRRA